MKIHYYRYLSDGNLNLNEAVIVKTEFSCGECWHVQKILNIMSRGRAGCISDYYMIIINFMSTQNFYSRYHQKNRLKYTASLLVLFQILPRDSLPRILQKHWTTINYRQQTRAFFHVRYFVNELDSELRFDSSIRWLSNSIHICFIQQCEVRYTEKYQ